MEGGVSGRAPSTGGTGDSSCTGARMGVGVVGGSKGGGVCM